ncbi:MAG: 4Fe-4S dicluster domain-containing protein [bacterium]|nr:4Fe-4S dicluster domain-containing protein [bacterium]
MRLFSGRSRPAALGPLPAERLPRTADPVALDALPPLPDPPRSGSDRCVSRVIDPIIRTFTEARHADVASARATMPSPQAAVDNVKGYCYFLDADLVGVCELPEEAWPGDRLDGHSHGVSILVAHRRPIRRGEPGHDWIAGAEQTVADVRAMEIATVVARYLGTLGYEAAAHSESRSDVDHVVVAVAAGVLEVRRGRLTNPLVVTDFGLATITTSLALPVDQPLAPGHAVARARLAVRHALGVGGTRPGWQRLGGQRRAWHLGRYPMEKVRRVDEPTTLIIEEEIERAAARHNFFTRARAGDLGERPRREVGRFIEKAPHGLATRLMLNDLVPLQTGAVAAQIAAGTEDPDANADAVKALGHFLGADMTGVCDAPSYAWYSHTPDGEVIEPKHRNAIIFVLDQGYETMEGASGDDWISGAQSMRAYLRASMIACTLAAHLRSLGWAAQAHTAAYDEVNHIPLLLRAGIGELSRIGELVLNPFVGPRFKSGVVTTDMPLTSDRPIDFGLQDFCGKCNKCARECPVGAIRFGPKVMFNGYEMWKPDVDRCARYRITNMRGSACGRCMKTCPYNVEGVLSERPFQWAAMRLPFTRAWIARLDDRLGRGAINPAKKWWLDFEMVDNAPVDPPKGANARGLNLEKKPRDEASFALFPPSIAPPGADGMSPFPLDRKQGIEASRAAESPEEARCRAPRP